MRLLVQIGILLLCFFPVIGEAQGIEDALRYHQNSGLQWDAAMEMLNNISWQGNERVLDVGCGDGKITAFIANSYTKNFVTGLDTSSSLIDFAASKFSKAEFPNLSFIEGSADALPYSEQFDIVVSFSTLHWLIDQERALTEISKSLVSGGKSYIITYGKAPMNISTLSESLISSEKWAADFPDYKQQRVYFTEEEYKILLDKVGFENVQLSKLDSTTWFLDREALFNFIKPLINFITHLSPEKQTLFMDELVDKIISLGVTREDGAIPLHVSKLQVIAKKNE